MPLYDFLSGAVVMGYLVCCLFFLRYWRRTRDRLFMYFAVAFALLSFGQGMFALANVPSEHRLAIFLTRRRRSEL